MNDIPNWVWPLLTLLAAAAGSWGAVKVTVAKIEVKVELMLETVRKHTQQIGQHNEDLLVHDMELETVLAQLKLPRKRRQPLRDWET